MMTSAAAGDAAALSVRSGSSRRGRRTSLLPLIIVSAVLLPFVGLPLAFIFYGAIQPPSAFGRFALDFDFERSEEHTSELQSLMRISYAVFCLKKKISNLLRIPNLYRKHSVGAQH